MEQQTVFVERDCVFTHEGKSFESGGAVITPSHCVGYLGKDGVLTDWHGNSIGTYRIVSTWRTPQSYVSSTMNAVHATVNGKVYKGRSAGVGMVFTGKAGKA